MRYMLFKDRLYCLFHTRNKNILYLKKLPIEKRYCLRYGIVSYDWKYITYWHKNVIALVSYFLTYISPRRQINKEWYDLHSNLCLWILPRLRKLRKEKHGTPSVLFKKPVFFIQEPEKNKEEVIRNERNEKKAISEWNSILDDMIFAFEYFLLCEVRYYGSSTPNMIVTDAIQQQRKARHDRGLEAFKTYFWNLWD